MAKSKAPVEISVRVDSLGQLFHSLDPSPFSEKDLTRQAEEFIANWARDTASGTPLKLIINIPDSEAETRHAREAPVAVRKFFASRSAQAERELKELFGEGRQAAIIGVPVLVACMLLSQYLGSQVEEPALVNLIGQSLLILGWVANWRPIEIFLYDWWPIRRRSLFYQRLARAEVQVRPYRQPASKAA